jgi:hypothetical protein
LDRRFNDPASVTFNATSTVNGAENADFGVLAIDTSLGGAVASTGTYSSSAWKLTGLPDTAAGGLSVNAVAAVPEPSTALLMGLALAGFGFIARTRSRQ